MSNTEMLLAGELALLVCNSVSAEWYESLAFESCDDEGDEDDGIDGEVGDGIGGASPPFRLGVDKPARAMMELVCVCSTEWCTREVSLM